MHHRKKTPTGFELTVFICIFADDALTCNQTPENQSVLNAQLHTNETHTHQDTTKHQLKEETMKASDRQTQCKQNDAP